MGREKHRVFNNKFRKTVNSCDRFSHIVKAKLNNVESAEMLIMITFREDVSQSYGRDLHSAAN